jgi:endonuclease/exonuclease/phosphatase family metal-dependent hydrolase
MFKLITWNIQSARTPAGGADLERIIACLDRFSDFDVLCVQEVACGYDSRNGSPGTDQFAGLAALLPGYDSISGIVTDTRHPGGGRRQLGSMIFSRHPILQAFRHSLPWPPDPEVMSMPRGALEATVAAPFGLLRVTTTHLEYFSEHQRMAQVERLRELHREAWAHALAERPGDDRAGPFAAVPRGASAVLAGDFNMLPHSPEYLRMLASFADGTLAYRDAWQLAQPGRRHAPTVGLHDDSPDAGLPFTFDYFFVSADLAGRVRQLRVDGSEGGSDHQAVLLELE